MSEKVIQSYVFHQDSGSAFFVSTITRDSDCPAAPDMTHEETIVWEWDEGERKRGEQIHQDGGHGLSKHFDICRQLRLTAQLDREGGGDGGR